MLEPRRGFEPYSSMFWLADSGAVSLYHSVPLFPHPKTGAAMASSLSDAESVKQNNRWIRVTESRCPEPTRACGVFSLHAYVGVHVSSSYWLCLGVLERSGEGVDSCPEARCVKGSELLGPGCSAGTQADAAIDIW